MAKDVPAPLRKLLCIEAVFDLGEQGLVVVPSLAWGSGLLTKDEAAEIRRPDGCIVPCELYVYRQHVSRTLDAIRAGEPPFHRVCILKSVAHSNVTIGSEIWCSESLAQDGIGDPAG